jgi:hypothetical protein
MNRTIRATLPAVAPQRRQSMRPARSRLSAFVALIAILACSPINAKADTVLDWSHIATNALVTQSAFAQARYMAITQLAVFEAVNAITGDYEPYLGTVVAPAGASPDAAAIAAAYRVLKNYFPLAETLDTSYAASLASIADSTAKTDGIATGETAAAQMIALRAGDGSSPPEFYLPESSNPGDWQTSSTCPAAGGVNFHWQNITPFGMFPRTSRNETWFDRFMPRPPPAVASSRYAKDYAEVKAVGSVNSTARPQDRADVTRFYTASSPTFVFNQAARQLAVAQGKSLSENARALALLNMATNDSLVASFGAKYFYLFWRPETAIRAGALDDNAKTDPDVDFVPFIATPCFPSYPSNHAAGSNSAAEVMRRLYGAGGHAITMANPAVPGITLHYNTLRQITDDIDDARVYGGIHFRFDQDAGRRLGREIAGFIYKHNLRSAQDPD